MNKTQNDSVDGVRSTDKLSTTSFRFIEFNQRRAMRGADAARVAVIENGEEICLWMSKHDISRNMMTFGICPELTKAFQAYSS